jgi:vacuolar protein sorting-associated protein 26
MLTCVLGETIPIRLFLGGFDLTPTFREVNKRFSTRYYLSLVLIDEGASQHFRSWSIGELSGSSPYLIGFVDMLTSHARKDARRYFKQSEIVLFRQAPEGLAPPPPQQSELTPA